MKYALTLILGGLLAGSVIRGAETDDFFTRQVLPILERRCFECHSHAAPSAKGGLYLDSQSGWELGGNSGPAIVPGEPDASLLIRAVRHTDEDLRMPPKGGRLSGEQVAILERWVGMGAPDPRRTEPESSEGEPHWAFKPVVKPAVPAVRDPRWARTAVDRFVQRRLEDQGMRPSPRADKSVLVRRLYYDLIGLAPTFEEIERFENDRSPDAFDRLVDRLLASPRYGERWARHWLDISRYADTKGYLFEEERRFPYSYTYRDYVVDAFNRDLPYDRFVQEQLAADLLDRQGDPQPLAGMGYLTLGRRFLNNAHDIIDDRIDVVTRGLMGLTVSCARCHDHKYDPIPTADYYSLYGVFASSQEPSDRPVLAFNPDSPAYREFQAERGRRQKEWDDYRITQQRGAISQARKQTGDYLQVLFDARKENRSELENLVRKRKLGPVIAFRWLDFMKDRTERSDPVFGPWLAAVKAVDDSRSVPETLEAWLAASESGEPELNPAVAAELAKGIPEDIPALAKLYGELFSGIEAEWLEAAGEREALADPAREALRQALYREGAPPKIALGEATQLLDVPTQQKIRRLKRELDGLPATHPGAPARAMSLEDKRRPVDPVVFVRGLAHNRGDQVPRQFLALIEGGNREPFVQGSGRLELARAIVAPDNPLTARVIVNRLWRHHFGQGLVDTPSDFGTRAKPPSHPELLDFLAARLMEDGWSLKGIHRLILRSSIWQQTSRTEPWMTERDPDNRWLSRMNRRRLELEPLRDTMLQVAGKLDLTMGGKPVEIAEPPYTPRRSIYGFIERQNLPGLFRTFDLASPDTSSPGRFETTVPQQALFLLNSPFVTELAGNLAAKVIRETADESEAITALFRTVLQRSPTRQERERSRLFLGEAQQDVTPAEGQPLWLYGWSRGEDTEFVLFDGYRDGAWRQNQPREGFEEASLNAKGGRTGSGPNDWTIRRWVAPEAGYYEVDDRASHSGENGIAGWIEVAGGERIYEMSLKNGTAGLESDLIWLKAGQALDFVVRGEGGAAAFEWNVTVRMLTIPLIQEPRVWNSRAEFSGPSASEASLSSPARLGQALMLSNEFGFVD